MKTNVFFVVSVILFVFLLSFKLEVFNKHFYDKQFVENNVYNTLGKETVTNETQNIMDYLKGKADLTTNFFNEKEKLHLKDVKTLIFVANILFYLSLVLMLGFLIYFIKTKNIKEIKVSLSIACVSVLVILLVLFLFDFSDLFLEFHKILFSNNLWLLNPLEDKLIIMFPEPFFYKILIEIVMNILLITAIIILINTKILNNVKLS
ncbi:MAG: TIGR01906 family membrane protein [Candidatus Nanoarchaeia archaeon]|nr:TIGR01906 family membrane protein [Candidatus Nanoarchaeia archaeon]